ncbi:probable manganese-transporting ATPase PDR2 [Tanacetum coccineum]
MGGGGVTIQILSSDCCSQWGLFEANVFGIHRRLARSDEEQLAWTPSFCLRSSVDTLEQIPGCYWCYCNGNTKKEEFYPADMLILEGCLIVSESTLTDESVPQLKVSVKDKRPEEHLSYKRDKKTRSFSLGIFKFRSAT